MSLTGRTFWVFYNCSRSQLKLWLYIFPFLCFTRGVSLRLSLWGWGGVDGTLGCRI